MRNFIIFFKGNEGSSPLVRLLNNFQQISIVHQVNNLGWEPFDRHNCGAMPLRSLERCLDIVLNKSSIDMKRLNQIYTRTAKRPLEEIKGSGAVGFKMRFVPPKRALRAPLKKISKLSKRYYTRSFRHMMIRILRRNDVVVLWAVRQDVLRWALSKYHGDGTGKSGHLQFKLASRQIRRDNIGKIHIDCTQLEKIISKCERSHAQRRRLIGKFRLAGIQSYPLCYEDFQTDKQKFFNPILDILEIKCSKEEINTALKEGAHFKKVHSNDISTFVENHEEVIERFGHRFVSWS